MQKPTNPQVHTVNYKKEQKAPDSPPSDQIRTYFDSDGVMKILDSDGSAREVVTDPPTPLDGNTFVYTTDDGTFATTDEPTDGQLLIGKTGDDPQVGNIFAAEDEGVEVTYDDPDILIGLVDADASTKGAVTAGTQTFGGAKTFADKATFSKGQQSTVQTVTATTNGDTTGVIPAGASRVDVTSSVNTKKVALPTPTPGTRTRIYCAANGYKLIASDPTNIYMNNVKGASVTLAVAAGDLLDAECIDATHWYIIKIGNDGTVASAGTPS